MRFTTASLLAITAPALAQSFTGLGVPPLGSTDATGLSADGLTVVGNEFSPATGQSAYYWRVGVGRVALDLPPGFHDGVALAVSGVGSFAAGYARNSLGNNVALHWTGVTPIVIGTLPDGIWSHGLGISRSGTIVVGSSDWDFMVGPEHAFRWNGSMLDLGTHPNVGLVDFDAVACSDDGSVVIGNANDLGGTNRVFRWTAATGMVDIGSILPADNTYAGDVSANGSVIVGTDEETPFRWTASGVVPLPLPPGMVGGSAFRVTGDGSVSAGYTHDNMQKFATYWDAAGAHDLAAALGAALPTGWTLNAVFGISDDGRTFAGVGTNSGTREAWIATLAPAGGCYPNCDNSTTPPVLNIQDFTCFLNRFASAETYANCDASTTPPTLNIQDFTCFLNAFAAGCS